MLIPYDGQLNPYSCGMTWDDKPILCEISSVNQTWEWKNPLLIRFDFPFEPPITLHFPIVCYIFPWFSHGFPIETSGKTVGPGTGLLDNT